MPEIAIAQPTIEQSRPAAEQTPKPTVVEKKDNAAKRLGRMVREKLFHSKTNPDVSADVDPDEILGDILRSKESAQSEWDRQQQEQRHQYLGDADSDLDVISDTSKSPEGAGEDVVGVESDSTKDAQDTTVPAGIPPTYQELRVFHGEQTRVKREMDHVITDIDDLSKDNNIFTQERIKKGLDWIVEDSSRVTQATEYILTQEDVVDSASNLRGLNAGEKESIDSMRDVLNKVKSGLKDRGIAVESLKQSSEKVGVIDDGNVETAGVPTDPETAFEYAYHATYLINMPSVAESGLLPSEAWSKEPGTVFYSHYNEARNYLPVIGVLYRTHFSNIPEFRDNVNDWKSVDSAAPDVSRALVPPKLLEYSLDCGQTWRHDFGKFANKD